MYKRAIIYHINTHMSLNTTSEWEKTNEKLIQDIEDGLDKIKAYFASLPLETMKMSEKLRQRMTALLQRNWIEE